MNFYMLFNETHHFTAFFITYKEKFLSLFRYISFYIMNFYMLFNETHHFTALFITYKEKFLSL
jgi:hypothetical protein